MGNREGNKVIMVVLDGLRYDSARRYLGYLEHLVEQGAAACRQVRSELPSLSRPLYEVLLTGTPAVRNGITANPIARRSRELSLFHLAADGGLTTAAAAYHWVSELYNSAPFNPLTDRHQYDMNKPIQNGIFYFEDSYPDSHLFSDAEYLRGACNPDFLYIHSMNIDYAGHLHGGESKEYAAAVRTADTLLAMLVPQWTEEGYLVIVTSDHGMSADGQHGGTDPEERLVPLYILSPSVEFKRTLLVDEPLPQLEVMPMVADLLGLEG
ncbi:alkaline phosphatase family protein [Cohnella thailandensis]|uniref:Alkaline phosphatase family protein n=1 Tax=Cohnella thailandensis TaxID=557557 RepID=A0A841SYJ6_9BACL|nr:alkaline phosphatase family protein [Cohnella thailandensis]MBB6634677.1 alkaline phosphatase family protein [Cohnella thailandensis]MBP1972767.1 putative AlkP superfamily pyrophosphatase or phosphodiesterase [Cohnella thailandensis]